MSIAYRTLTVLQPYFDLTSTVL